MCINEFARQPVLNNTSALILAGGNSSRMKTDKVYLPLKDGLSMLHHAIAFWNMISPDIMIAAGIPGRPMDISARIVYDKYVKCGPLSGIHAGLSDSRNDLVFVSAVDMPSLEAEDARRLYREIGEHDICLYRVEGRPEPLFGLYRKTCCDLASELLSSGQTKVTELLNIADTLYIDTIKSDCFSNLNTPEDYQGYINTTV